MANLNERTNERTNVMSAIKPAIAQLRAEIATDTDRLDRKRRVLTALEEIYAPPSVDRAKRGTVVEIKKRGKVRRARAKAAKALRGKAGRLRPLVPGGLADRLVAILREHACPIRLSVLVEEAKAPKAAVQAQLKALRAAKRVVLNGTKAGARWALTEFANVIVAGD